MVVLILAAALWFGLQALEALLAYLQVQTPQSRLLVFVYCLVAMLLLLYFGGWLPAGHAVSS